MQDDDKLSLDLVWQADGHLTEVALTALADGEEALLPEGALGHAAGCGACSAALGHAALLSLRAGEALRGVQALTPPAAAGPSASQALGEPLARAALISSAAPVQSAAPQVPVAAILAALTLAALGAAPALVGGVGRIAQGRAQIGHTVVVVLRTARAVAESGAVGSRGWLAALSWCSAALLVMLGLAVARATGKRLSLGEGT